VNAEARAYRARKGRRECVYVLTHPLFPGYVKVGRSTDPLKRLQDYNVGDPLRRYSFHHVEEFPDSIAAEAAVHKLIADLRVGATEWLLATPEYAVEAITSIRRDGENITH